MRRPDTVRLADDTCAGPPIPYTHISPFVIVPDRDYLHPVRVEFWQGTPGDGELLAVLTVTRPGQAICASYKDTLTLRGELRAEIS